MAGGELFCAMCVPCMSSTAPFAHTLRKNSKNANFSPEMQMVNDVFFQRVNLAKRYHEYF